MRVGLDLRPLLGAEARMAAAIEADRLGLWAVLIGVEPGREATEAAAIAVRTDHIIIGLALDGRAEHPMMLAEEVSVVDHLSRRRALAVVDADPGTVERIDRLLAGHIIDGVILTPPPAQTLVTVWSAGEVVVEKLTGELDRDTEIIDRHREEGTTHLFVTWPEPGLLPLARHLMTRAADPNFPPVVAEWADRLEPPNPRPSS